MSFPSEGGVAEVRGSRVPIACAVDEAYVLPLAVMLESLKERLGGGLSAELYLIHGGIRASSVRAISAIVDTEAIRLTEAQLSAMPQDRRFPREASVPLLLAELLPGSLERVLFLDADTLVLGDVGELWRTPLEKHTVGAVADSAVPLCSAARGVKGWQALGIPRDAAYFNGGVLLIDLERWREGEVTQRALRYLESTREPIDFLHQEALNAVLWNDWRALDARWNLLASHAGRPYDRGAPEAWRAPGVVHFAGRMKPWRAPIGGPFDAPYREALQRSPATLSRRPPSVGEWLCSVYDRRFRSLLYPLEHYLWRHRIV